MVHSIELVFDAETEAVIRRLWSDLAAAGVPSQVPEARPHVTLAVAEHIGMRVDALLAPAATRLPFDCTLGAPLLFGRSHGILARLVVPTFDLLAVQADVYRRCAPHLVPAPMAHTAPGQWTGHVTLARRVTPDQLSRALRTAGRPAELTGGFVGLRHWDGDTRTEHPIG